MAGKYFEIFLNLMFVFTLFPSFSYPSSEATIMETSTFSPSSSGFSSSAFKGISSVPPPLPSVCPQSSFLHAASILHHPSCLLSFVRLQANPLSWQQPWIPLTALSHHLAARYCHLQRTALTVTTAWEMGNSKSGCWRSSSYIDFGGF